MKRQLLLLVPLLASSQLLSGAPLQGSFGNTGLGAIAFTQGGANLVDFCPVAGAPTGPTNPGCAVLDNGLGQVFATGTASGDFAGMAPFTAVTIKDISNQPGIGAYTYFPIDTPVMIDNFISVAGAFSALNFQANLLTCAACLPGEVVQLTSAGPTQTSASVTFQGTVFDAEGVSGTFEAILTAQFNRGIDEVRTLALTPGGVLTQSYSMDVIVTPIPEPTAMALIGSALLLAPIAIRIRRRRA